ncbi:MAG: hypothetical protein Q8L01_02140 [Candidatus Woesebacteria bacterium]|nr:hypothetical protein [Candidatus Woesebacteria bacterium]
MIKKKEERITNTELLESINRSFSKVEEKIDTKVEELKSQIEGVDKRIDDFAENKVSKTIFKELNHRVSFIEEKLEIKK